MGDRQNRLGGDGLRGHAEGDSLGQSYNPFIRDNSMKFQSQQERICLLGR